MYYNHILYIDYSPEFAWNQMSHLENDLTNSPLQFACFAFHSFSSIAEMHVVVTLFSAENIIKK